MRGFIVAILLFIIFFFVLGTLFLVDYNAKEMIYKPYIAEKNNFTFSNESQFYPNTRYRDKVISYHIEDVCDNRKREDMIGAFDKISSRTVLTFVENKENPEITVLCSEIPPESSGKGHIVAGEGGPSEIVNATQFSVVLSGKISLFRSEKCDEPMIATHELLHALGFDHTNNTRSIMYPVSDCSQIIDRKIVDEINKLYSIPSYADLKIEDLAASKKGRYLNFNINISNIGLADSFNSSLEVYSDGSKIKEFEMNEIEIGTKKIFSVENVKFFGEGKAIDFVVSTNESEITKENNRVRLEGLEG